VPEIYAKPALPHKQIETAGLAQFENETLRNRTRLPNLKSGTCVISSDIFSKVTSTIYSLFATIVGTEQSPHRSLPLLCNGLIFNPLPSKDLPAESTRVKS
jgi:hypothetical protein